MSADLVGSTSLKNRLNQYDLYLKYRDKESLAKSVMNLANDHPWDIHQVDSTILASLGIGKEDFDWANVVERFYEDLFSEFTARLHCLVDSSKIEKDSIANPLWKAVGDELIFQIPVSTRLGLHYIVSEFLSTLRKLDRPAKRLKGCAWVAGFPIRNRSVRIPGGAPEDYLGPDMDIGFRLGKESREGMLVASTDLAELLGEVPQDVNPVRGQIVDWKELKGVWDNHSYPIIWLELPSGHDKELNATEFTESQQSQCEMCGQWELSKSQRAPIREIRNLLEDSRSALPSRLGIVDPYILGDTDDIPVQHQTILTLLTKITEFTDSARKEEEAPQGEEYSGNATELASEAVNPDND